MNGNKEKDSKDQWNQNLLLWEDKQIEKLLVSLIKKKKKREGRDFKSINLEMKREKLQLTPQKYKIS